MSKLQDLKKIIFSTETPVEETTVVEEKFMDLEDTNGTKIHVVTSTEGEITVGDVVLTPGEGEEMVPAADGEYQIDSIKKIIVVSEGKVAEIKDMSEEVEPEPEPAPAEEPEMSSSVDERLTKIETALEEILQKFSKVEQDVEEIGKTPASEPKKVEKMGFQMHYDENLTSEQKRAKELTEFINKQKTNK